MTKPTHAQISEALFWICLVLNAAAIGMHLYLGRYEWAGVQSVFPLTMAWSRAWFARKHVHIDAEIREAEARATMSERTLVEMEKAIASGRVRFDVEGQRQSTH